MPFVKEEVGQIVSLGDSRIKRVRDRIAGSGIEDGPEVPEVQRQHNVQRTIRLRRVGVVTGHAYTAR